MNTGSILAGHPSVGSWVTYGLGSENENLPGFIVFTDHRGGPINGPPNWSNGYLPAAYQGMQIPRQGHRRSSISSRPSIARRISSSEWLRFLHDAEREAHRPESARHGALGARAFVRAGVPHADARAGRDRHQQGNRRDARSSTASATEPTDYFGRQLLMARRLVERGVRYVQIFSGGGNFEPSWDAHWNLKDNHGLHCAETDMPLAGLIKDLKSRGMFDETLIVWHGEFGRLPISERMSGRDHNNKGFTVWLAGGGVKGGTCVGSTDQYGYAAAENPKSVYELHATILHLLGLDYENLTYRFNGRDMRLTDVHGKVIKEIVA